MADAAPASRGGFKQGFGGSAGGAGGAKRGGRGRGKFDKLHEISMSLNFDIFFRTRSWTWSRCPRRQRRKPKGMGSSN